jgi:hypothetical protein
VLDYAAGALELAAKWVVGNKDRRGHLLHLLSGLAWIAVALTVPGARGLLLVCVPALWINVRNYRKWGREMSAVIHAANKVPVDVSGQEPPAECRSVLAEADVLVHGSRNNNYGHPADDFARTGRMWGAILGLDGPVPPDRVALCMCAVKVSRECNRHKRDNLVDLAGYAETCQMVHERAREVPRGASISRPVGKDRSIE